MLLTLMFISLLLMSTVDRDIMDRVLSALGCQAGSVMLILSTMLMFG